MLCHIQKTMELTMSKYLTRAAKNVLCVQNNDCTVTNSIEVRATMNVNDMYPSLDLLKKGIFL